MLGRGLARGSRPPPQLSLPPSSDPPPHTGMPSCRPPTNHRHHGRAGLPPPNLA
jgi:hypothetical protein